MKEKYDLIEKNEKKSEFEFVGEEKFNGRNMLILKHKCGEIVKVRLNMYKNDSFGCKKCSYIIRGQKLKGVSKIKIGNYVCDICGRKYSKSTSLAVHKQSHNEEYKKKRSEISRNIMKNNWNREDFRKSIVNQSSEIMKKQWASGKENISLTQEQWKIKFNELYPEWKFIKHMKDRYIEYECKEGHTNYITDSNLYKGYELNCRECNPVGSAIELKLLNECKEYGEFTKCHHGEMSGKEDPNYEIDIFNKQLMVGFEYNGFYWHCLVQPNIDKFYHKRKTEWALKRGIKLYHLWENNYNKLVDIIKSKLGLNKKLYARYLILCEPRGKSEIDIFEENHLEGYAQCFRTFGLYDMKQGELISALSLRNNGPDIEIARYVTKSGITVVGGFSKLMSAVKANYSGRTLITYTDRDLCPDYHDSVYYKYGFDFIGDSGPILKYYDVTHKEVIPRQKLQKHKLKALFPDSYSDSKSADQILAENNIYPMWNSGNFKFKIQL